MKENTGAVHAQVPVDVATYLLNEKRAEFHSIESRLKVNVVLIPNIHLETPNYTITRLKHEELNQADVSPPSYEMVAMPEKSESGLPLTQAEPASPRQEAVVKGITPAQPAPIMEPTIKPEPPQPAPSIIGKIFGWFRRGQPAAETATVQPAHPRGDRSEERSPFRGRLPQQRNHRRNGQRERPARLQRDEKQSRDGETPRPQRDQQKEQLRRESQRPRMSRPERPQMEAAALQAQPHEPRPRNEAEGRGRRRRRGGRDRFEARDAQTVGDATLQQVEDTPKAAPPATTAPAAGVTPETAVTAPPDAAVAATQAETPSVAPVVEIGRGEPMTAASTATPVTERVGEPMLPSSPISPAPATLEPLVLPPDLQLIETDPEKLRFATSKAEPSPPPRPPRVRPPLPPVSDEPLVQVETRR